MSEVSLGKRISKLRKQRNWTQGDLAEKIGMSTSTVAMWETDKRDPDSEMLTKIAALFDVTVDFILGRDESPVLIDPSNDIPPEVNVFFKDFLSAPEERREEMLRFWRFIQEHEKGRKPGDKQGE